MADQDFTDTGSELSPQQARDILASLAEKGQRPSSTAIVQETVTLLYKDIADEIRAQDEFERTVRKQVIANLPTMSNKELIALNTSISQTKNDLVSKTVSPMTQIINNAQINELNEKREQQKQLEQQHSPQGISGIASSAPNDVMVGFKAISDLVSLFQQSGDVSIMKNVRSEGSNDGKTKVEEADDFKPEGNQQS